MCVCVCGCGCVCVSPRRKTRRARKQSRRRRPSESKTKTRTNRTEARRGFFFFSESKAPAAMKKRRPPSPLAPPLAPPPKWRPSLFSYCFNGDVVCCTTFITLKVFFFLRFTPIVPIFTSDIDWRWSVFVKALCHRFPIELFLCENKEMYTLN